MPSTKKDFATRGSSGIEVVFAGAALLLISFCIAGCKKSQPHIAIGSKFFTEQVILAELVAQHIEARTGLHVVRKTNLGGTLLCQKALLAGELDLYVEYTGTALTAVLAEAPGNDDSATIYRRVKDAYATRFNFDITEPLGFANSFAMVVRQSDAQKFALKKMSDLATVAPKWRIGVGYEFLERVDGFKGWSAKYGLRFAETPREMDLGLLYRALVTGQVDVAAGNSTDGLIETLKLVPLEDDRHYFPPYDAVPVVRHQTLEKFPELRAALADLGGKITEEDMRRMNAQVDAEQKDPAAVVKSFREQHNL
jgi:osmoprotectant transport system substrate-binding protein